MDPEPPLLPEVETEDTNHYLDYDLNGTFVVSKGSKIAYMQQGSGPSYVVHLRMNGTAFYVGGGGPDQHPSYSTLMENISSYPFDQTSMSMIIALSMCFVIGWSVCVASFISRKDRPLLQLFTFLYVAVIITLHFGIGLNFWYYQNSLGYLSGREWFETKLAGSPALTGLLLSCFTLVLSVEVQLLTLVLKQKWLKRALWGFGSVFVAVDTVLWALSYTNSWETVELPYYLEVWSGFEVSMQVMMFCVVTIWAVGCYRFAFEPQNLGIAILSLLGCIAPIVTTSLNFDSHIYYVYLLATLCARCWACMMVFQWSSAVKHGILKQRTTGSLGAQISKRSASCYDLNGDGTAAGDSSEIARFGHLLQKPFGDGYHIRSVTVETRERKSFEDETTQDLPVHTYPLCSAVTRSSAPTSSEPLSPPASPPAQPGSPPPIIGPGPSNIPGSSGNAGLPGIDEAEIEEDLPDFVPHPRFHRADYWDEKRNVHF